MSRYTGPKARIARRFGINLLSSPKYDKILAKRNFPPGVHGRTKFAKPTEFGKQLLEKQKARFLYGISERQCQKYYREAIRLQEESGKALLTLFERRLDNVLYRAGFTKTRMQARQLAAHGLFLRNGHRITVPSYIVEVGDVFKVREKKKSSPLFQGLEQKMGKETLKPASWLKVDPNELTIEIVRFPELAEMEHVINPNAIVEFYSK